MSNYSPIVLYGPKDALTTGDPNKLIKGVQLDSELSAIATAIGTKLDSGTNATFVGAANQYAVQANGSATTGQSLGSKILAGTNSSDFNLVSLSATGTSLFTVRGDGHLFGGSVDFTPSSGSFSATYGGVISGSVTINYIKIGAQVTLYCSTASTPTSSGSGSFSITALPAAIRPTVTVQGAGAVGFAGGTLASVYGLTSAGVMTFSNTNGGAFTGPNNLGFVIQTICTYVIQ